MSRPSSSAGHRYRAELPPPLRGWVGSFDRVVAVVFLVDDRSRCSNGSPAPLVGMGRVFGHVCEGSGALASQHQPWVAGLQTTKGEQTKRIFFDKKHRSVDSSNCVT